jgi:hypothetical protein
MRKARSCTTIPATVMSAVATTWTTKRPPFLDATATTVFAD